MKVRFENGVVLTEEEVIRCKNSILKAIQKELREEAQCVSVIKSIMNELSVDVESFKINLQR
ncbi:hypothetical protein [Peptostreptococcus faecalis]|uniref:hypothetical protein n=1 Tax=Peptostreptococcus faecalis TaxID=2045015 RepID=UPI000C7D0E20|nr:hypothetical protein [Peptostreptococcus faecalis]